MTNKDVYDILKSLEEEPEHNSHEGFNRSNYKLSLTFIYNIQIILKRIFTMKRKKKKKKKLIYIKLIDKKRQKMILIMKTMIGKMIKMTFLIISQNLIQIQKRKKKKKKNLISLQI